MPSEIIVRGNLKDLYKDIYTSGALSALSFLSHFNNDVKTLMSARLKRRAERQQKKQRIAFLDPESVVPRTNIKVNDARDGRFEGSLIPHDLHRQWIQGTGPAAKPNTPVKNSIRNVAYALLSGADGWMFDGEDALGQVNCKAQILPRSRQDTKEHKGELGLLVKLCVLWSLWLLLAF